ncbi:MAG TPA: SURF1 family protein [Trueperaceae bacterium]|nr:SURF1 family protein [Trueperaceae bacterium]
MSASTTPVLLRPRWLAGHLLALVLIVLFLNLGAWQLRRLEARTANNQLISSRSSASPVDLSTAWSEFTETGDFPEYRVVTVSGRFFPQGEVLLRGRSLDGQPGFNLVTPLIIDDPDPSLGGAAVLVERGWVPYDHDSVPVADAPPPEGTVEVIGRLRPPGSAPGGLAPRDPAEGVLVQTYYVDTARLEQQLPFALVPAYVTATSMVPPQRGDLPRPLPADDLTAGPHRGYAIQWFAFALVGVVGYTILLRKVRRDGAGREG